jgi:inner membrane protein
MDLITQTVLGAAVGEVVLGKKAGNKAILWGAVGGLIPDLDVLITPFFNEVDGLFVHRGFSHSLIFAFLLAPPLGWLIHWIYRKKKTGISKFHWMNLIFWAAFTHPVLDYFTTYGTGAFLPFSDYRVEFGTIGIVDIFYTLPLILVLVVIIFINRASAFRRKLILSVVSITTIYLLGTVGNKLYMNSVFKNAFDKQNIVYERYRTVPLPLTNFLWMGLAETETGYYMGLYSNFDSEIPSEFFFIPRNEEKLQDILNNNSLQKLIRFTKGFYHVDEDENGLYLADLRFGRSGIDENTDYIFKFYIKETDDNLHIEQSRESQNIKADAFTTFIGRIKGI